MSLYYLLSAVDSGSEGYLIGQMIGPLLLLLGIFKCIAVMRRSKASKLCLASLLLVLLAWLLASLSQITKIQLGLPIWVSLITMCLMTLFILVAVILAVLGLSLYEKPRFTQGRSQAIWALVLSLAHIAMVGVFIVIGILERPATFSGAVDVDQPTLGYKTRLSDLGWAEWSPTGENGLPLLAEFGAKTVDDVVLIMPYTQEQGDPPAVEALARAFLAGLDFSYQRGSAAFSTRPVEKPFPGLEITTEREGTDDRRYQYLFRVHQSGKHGWLVGGWTVKTKTSTLDNVKEALGRIELNVPVGKPVSRPSTSELTEARASFINQIGLWYHGRQDWTQAERFFREAARIQPDNFTFFDNITNALEEAGQPDAALKALEAATEPAFTRKHSYLFRQAWLRMQTGATESAIQQMLQLIKDGFERDDDVLDFINELLDTEHTQESRRIADAYAKARPEQRPRLWQAQVTDQVDEPEAALKLLEKLVTDEPGYLEARYSLGEMSNRQGQHEKALELADALAKDGQDTARLHLMRGWAHMGRKWYKDAKTSFELAARLAPENEKVKTALQDASASLGQGSNTEIKTPIPPVPLPQHVSSGLDESQKIPADFGKGHHAAWLLRATCMNFTKDKPMRTTIRRRVLVLNEEGADAFSTLEYSYDPLIERLHVNRVEVSDASGKVLARAVADDAYVLDADDGDMATPDRIVHIQVPGIMAGCTLDYEITIERLSKRERLPLRRHLFANSLPVRLQVVSLTGDVDSVDHELLRPESVKVTRESGSLIFEMAPPVLEPDESYATPTERWAPVLVLSGKGKSWEEIGQEYLKDIADKLQSVPEIEAEARRLTEGIEGERERVRALSAFVQRTIRYKAIEFGVRGHIPNPPALTLKQRYGDCKDQAVLLHHLLRAAGITSHLALMNTSWELDLKQPDMDQFNHMLVFVPGLPVPGVIDTTQSNLAVADHCPIGLWYHPVFVLDPTRPDLKSIPGPSADSSLVVSKRTLSLLPPEGLRVVEELTLHGYYASSMRSNFVREEPKARLQHAQDILHGLGDHRLEDFEFINLNDPTLPAILRLSYTFPAALEKRGEDLKLRLPHAWEKDYLRLSFIKERTTPFRWDLPFRMISEVRFDPSLKLTPQSLAAFGGEGTSPFGRWQMKPAGADTLHFDFAVTPGSYEAADYATFQALWSAALDSWGREASLQVPE